MRRLDDYPGIAFPFFDEDHKVLYIAGKGESAITYYQFSKSGSYLEPLSAFKGREPQKGFSMMPKRSVDPIESEVMRGVRMTAKTIEYVQFKVPRKTGGFTKDLFPDWRTAAPAHDFESYWAGTDKEPLREVVNPEHTTTGEKKVNFLTKLTGVADHEAAKPVLAKVTVA
jgi:coronin-1B/1C/6